LFIGNTLFALIDNEITRTAVKNDITEAQQLDQYMDALQQSIADKQTTLDSSQYINADPNVVYLQLVFQHHLTLV
jgi:hypothetical protein